MPDAPPDSLEPDSDPDKAAAVVIPDDSELEAAIAAIRGNKDLPRPPYPTLPNLSAPTPMPTKVQAVQACIEKLSYNFTGVNYFDVRKQRPLGRILETAREITRQALPIKCVEAIFVATHLTQGLKELERIPVSFKSCGTDGQSYKHIILALKYNSKWGSVGLSRRRELYFKELCFDSLADLFLEFKRSYERVFHTLKRVKVRARRAPASAPRRLTQRAAGGAAGEPRHVRRRVRLLELPDRQVRRRQRGEYGSRRARPLRTQAPGAGTPAAARARTVACRSPRCDARLPLPCSGATSP